MYWGCIPGKILSFIKNHSLASAVGGALLIIISAERIWSFSLIDKFCLRIQARADRETLRRRPKRIILIRHGETPANLDSKVYAYVADNQIPLNDKGIQQAQEAGEKLRHIIPKGESIKFYFSPFKRTFQTFEEIRKFFENKTYKSLEDPRLREQEWGNFQHFQNDPNKLEKVYEERDQVGRFFYRFPTGESGADVYDRDMDTFSTTPADNIVIITHGFLMRVFLMRYFKWSQVKFNRVWNPKNCEIWLLLKDNKGQFKLETRLMESSI